MAALGAADVIGVWLMLGGKKLTSSVHFRPHLEASTILKTAFKDEIGNCPGAFFFKQKQSKAY